MSRRRKDAASISLLPILSIQKCTMGIMVVLICAQNLVSLGETQTSEDQVMEIAGSDKERELGAVYVECQKDTVLIHATGQEVPLADLKGKDPSPFHALLEELSASNDKKHLVLLIRPEGIATYERCYRMAREQKITVGKDALLSGGKVILTKEGKPLFTRKKGER